MTDPAFTTPVLTPALTVLAVDDEPPALDELAYLLRADPRVGTVLTAADAPAALLRMAEQALDAVFLDIRMPGLDGVELARVFAGAPRPPAIIFVTAHDDRALDAYDVGALDYLLKPVRAGRLAESITRIRPTPTDDEVVAVELGGSTTLVARSTVRWVEAHGDYARLHTATGSHLVRIPLAVLEQRWSGVGFARVHRSYLVALPLVTALRPAGSGYVVRLGSPGAPGAVELPVSRRHVRAVRDVLVRDVLVRAAR